MKLPRRTKMIAIAVPIGIFLIFAMLYIWTFLIIPTKVTLVAGNEYVYDFIIPCIGEVTNEKDTVISCEPGGREFVMDSISKGETTVKLKAFGMLPIKSMKVSVMPNTPVIVCGTPLGVKMKTKGVLVTGMIGFNAKNGNYVSPGKEAGIKPGDIILFADNAKIQSSDDMAFQIENCKSNHINLEIERANRKMKVTIKPAIDSITGLQRAGLLIKDSAAGIGTMTFYDTESGFYGALGHGISDSETGILYPLYNGEIVEAHIFSVSKGEQGKPGELKGYFTSPSNSLGSVISNNNTGIYGIINPQSVNKMPGRKMNIGASSTVKEGKATILTTIKDGTTKEYEIEILRASRNRVNSPKGLVIKITDQELLKITGGIVQGMSGSPIIQNGQLIGAVTHVMINDPTTGYGIFIEGMLNNLVKQDAA